MPVDNSKISEEKRSEAFEQLMSFPKRLPADFDYKKELIEADL